MGIDNKLKKYIETNIFPKCEKSHGIEHIKYVIDRSFSLIKQNGLIIPPI